MIRIKNLVQTSTACPSQWEARTIDDAFVYIRYRHGRLRCGVGTTMLDAIDGGALRGTPYYTPGTGKTLFEKDIGDDLDGVMSTDEMLTHLKDVITTDLTLGNASNAIERLRGEAWGVNNRRQHEEDCDAVDALYQAMKRIASPDELTGDGPLDAILADPTGTGERELKARMGIAAAAVRRVEGQA